MPDRKLSFLNLNFSISDLWPLLLPILFFLPDLTGFPYPSPDAPYSDIAVSHYPNALFLKRALISWGRIPLWSPTILSGYPFFANPLSGLWYLPGWFALLFPLPLGFNLTVILHLLWGGLGLYIFLRSQRLNHHAALFGALVFEALPKIFAHYGAGHLTLLFAVSWTPWLLLAAVRGTRKLLSPWFFHPSVILALIFLADVRWAVFAGALWLTWELAHSQHFHLDAFLAILRRVVTAVLIAAPLALPLLEYTRLSTRANLTPEDVFAFSLPPARLLGFVFPDFGGNHEWTLYLGGGVLSLTLLSILWPRSRNRSSFWVWVFSLSILYSLGEYLPLLPGLARFPGFSLLRVPSRALFLTGLAGAVLAAFALNHLLAGLRQYEARRARLALASLTLFSIALALAIWVATRQIPLNIIWGAGILLVIFLWIIYYLAGRLPKNIWVLGVFVISLLDLGLMDQSLYSFRPASEVLSEGKEVAEYLTSQPGRFRVYSPSYSIPQQTAAFYGLELADGVDPLQLESYAKFMQDAAGVPRQGYSVTLPPFGDADPAISNAGYLPSTDLAFLNVRFIAAEFDLDIEYLELTRFGNTRLYELPADPGRVYINISTDRPVDSVLWSPNRIEVNVEGPGQFILSEIPYPGWQAYVNGQRVDIDSVSGVNRSIQLAEGEHQVIFVFRPLSLYLGLGLSVFILVVLIIGSRRNREKPEIE